MDINTRKLKVIRAILDCQDRQVIEAMDAIIQLERKGPPTTIEPGQPARPSVDDQEQATNDIQKEIDDTFLAF
jgi:hypothetical protein